MSLEPRSTPSSIASTASLLLFLIFPKRWLFCPLITVMRALYTAVLVSRMPRERVRGFYHVKKLAGDNDGTMSVAADNDGTMSV